MELRLEKRLSMSPEVKLGCMMLRWSSCSLLRRRTSRRHGAKTRVSGMSKMPSSITIMAGLSLPLPLPLNDGSQLSYGGAGVPLELFI
uniref:Uncharacterized protein n=1 Tax=Oryza brachyantha TaxID=4533 RepID=J3N482_ORYBR